MIKCAKVGFAVVAVLGTVSCSTSPLGRSQFTLLPDSQMNSMGSQSFEELKRSTPVETDARINAYIRCVVVPITRVAHDDTGVKDWEVVVFKENSANAFALPGGKIGVHTGILPIAKTPGQLAGVLGHEIGHVIARHGNERVSQGLVAQLGMGVAAALSHDHPQHQLLMGLLGAGAQVGIILPHSRSHESEADLIGQQLMAKVGFNPQESVDLWRNMAAAGGGQPPEFLSTHPSHSTRIHALSEAVSRNRALYEANAAHMPQCSL